MKKSLWSPRWAVAVLLLLALLPVGCASAVAPAAEAPPSPAVPPSTPEGAGPTITPVPLKPLTVEPVKGYVGDPFTVTAEGLPLDAEVEFIWVTVDGSYILQASPENVEFHEKKFVEKRVSLGRVKTDDQGQVTVSFTAPEDYGEVHDIYAVVGGEDVARGGFRILRSATIEPTEGPVGTPITFSIKGLGWKTYESTIALRYDNLPSGIVTAVTTRGSATIQIRAAGQPGKHVLDINHGAKSVPYLNNQQAGTAHIPDFRFWFTVTEDAGPPPFTLDWPDGDHVALASDAAPRTTASTIAATGVSATLEPSSGPILSQATLRMSNLSPNAQVELFWVTARGNRVSPSGWSLTQSPLLETTTNGDGALSATFQIPDDLGGWHVVQLVEGDKVLAEVPYYVERSLVDVTPRRVKAGETFTVQIKGVGWTELDNGVAVLYDNAYIGFACGFNSNGDATIHLVATGDPGTHLIDLYPMIYQGHGKPPWGYQVPILSFKEDFPGLALGYKLPAFRLAIEIIE
ncbi:MAG TPA: hypothetical protein DEP84_20250 [Chloroflexi bacterium]|nr:hypothetical protein [Chloroflexota bacterium]